MDTQIGEQDLKLLRAVRIRRYRDGVHRIIPFGGLDSYLGVHPKKIGYPTC